MNNDTAVGALKEAFAHTWNAVHEVALILDLNDGDEGELARRWASDLIDVAFPSEE